jgi:hypothetical protein
MTDQTNNRAKLAREMTHYQPSAPRAPLDVGALVQNGLLGASLAPYPVGDVAGLLADAAMYYREPESRTWANGLLSLTGALSPFSPSASLPSALLGFNVPIMGRVFRGSKTDDLGLDRFWSRDHSTAKGFDKGLFRTADVAADRALSFAHDVDMEAARPVLDAMRREGDPAADMLEQVLREDGAVPGAMFYMMMERVGSAAPEYYMKKAGVQAIDVGRDIRVLDPAVVRLLDKAPPVPGP